MVFKGKRGIILLVLVVVLLIIVCFEISQRRTVSDNSTRNDTNAISQNEQSNQMNASDSSNYGYIKQNDHQTVVAPSEKEQVYSYAPVTVTLEGFVKKMVGDTPDLDKKFTYYVLKLDKPINVKGNPDDPYGNTDSFENVTQLQFFTIGQASEDIRNLIDKQVIVHGQLLQVLDFPDFTDVMIQTDQIEEK